MEDIIQLIGKSRDGDREAFARIVEKYQGMVSAVTLNIVGDYAQSEDLAQETFLTAWKKLPELREPEKSASWFYGIAKRVALRWRERERKNPLQGAVELDEQTTTARQVQAETERREYREESLRLVWSTVRELPETLREPLLLYYRYTKSVADIAESMQLTEETVRQRLSRGRKMLKTEVEKQVESVLESTRPDTAFTLAVLASLPLAATMSGCSATSKSIGFLSGGAVLGGPWLVLAVLTCLGLLLFHSTATIALAAVIFYLLWHAIKQSPTDRTRRFVIAAALDFNLLLWVYSFFARYVLNELTLGHWEPGIDLAILFGVFPVEARAFLYGGLPVFLIFSGFMLHVALRWRQILYEDFADKSASTKTELIAEPSILGIRRKRNICMWAAIFCLILYIAFGIWQHAAMFSQVHVSDTVLTWFWGATAWFYLLQILFQLVFFRIVDRGIDLSENRDVTESTTYIVGDIATSTPAERRKILNDAAILLLAIPLLTMLLCVGLGFVRQLTPEPQEIGAITDMTKSTPRNTVQYYTPPLPSDQVIQIAQIEIVLVVLAVLWGSGNKRKRYAVYALLFFATGLMTVLFIEWRPLFQDQLVPRFAEMFYWWLPESDKESFRLGEAWESSLITRYLYWHVFAVTWLVYSLLVATVSLILFGIQTKEPDVE